MEEINRIDKQLEKHDLRMTKFEDNLHETNLKLERNNFLTEQNTEVMKEFGGTLKDVSNTMQQISFVVGTLVKDVKDVKDEITETNIRVDMINEKSHFDWQQCVKDKLIPFLLGAGGIGAIFTLILNYIK